MPGYWCWRCAVVERISTSEHHVRRLVLGGLGVLLLLAAAAGTAYPLWWQHRQDRVGGAEVRSLQRATSREASQRSLVAGGASSCTAVSGPGVLRIVPTDVVAPVEPGVSQQVLATSVGHVPSTPWPGQPGLAILEAHDVGYFAQNNSLRPGDRLTYTSGCATWTYQVSGKTIEQPGQAIRQPNSAASLALISCWPTDALWWTSHRLVVLATLVGAALVQRAPATATDAPAGKPSSTSVAAPSTVAGLPPGVPGGQPNVFDYIHAGTLNITGSPAATFTSSPLPLDWLTAALDALAAYRQGTELQASWVSTLVRQAPPTGWDGTPTGSLYAAEHVVGDTVESVTLLAQFVPKWVATMVIKPIAGHLYVVGGGIWPAPKTPPPS